MNTEKTFWQVLAWIFVILLFVPEGAMALIASGQGKTSKEAIAQAKRSAVESALSEFISPAEFKRKYGDLDKEVFQNIDAYIESYDILREEEKKIGSLVTLDAQVNTQKLKRYFQKNEGWIVDEEVGRLGLFLNKTSSSHLSGRSKEARYAYFELKNILEDEFGFDVVRNSMFGDEEKSSRRSRRGRGRVKKMVLADALDIAADLGAEHAALFDIKIKQDRRSKDRIVTCLLTLSIYDTEEGQKIESYEIESDAEYSRRGGSVSRDDARLGAIHSAVDQAAEKTNEALSQHLNLGATKVKKHKVLFKKFTQDEIQGILKKIESIDGFKKSRQLRQTARTYQTEISAASSRKDFIRLMKEILDDSDYKYSLNFDRKKIFITKFRVGKKGKDEAGLVEM